MLQQIQVAVVRFELRFEVMSLASYHCSTTAIYCWDTEIRTQNNSSKNCCVTITPCPNITYYSPELQVINHITKTNYKIYHRVGREWVEHSPSESKSDVQKPLHHRPICPPIKGGLMENFNLIRATRQVAF